MRLHDTMMFLGREHQREAWQFSTLESIQRTLDRYEIERAWVNAIACRTVDVFYGNDLLFESCAKDGRLAPCPCVIPNSGGEVGEEGAFLDELIRRGARGVCHYPKAHGTTLDPRVIGKLYEALQERRVPVALFETGLLEAATLADQYPQLPIILHAPHYRDRTFISAFKEAPNLMASIMPNLSPHRGVEGFCREIGVNRLLFATGYPHAEPGAPITYLSYADVSDDEREQIASRNAQRLAKDVRVPGQDGDGVADKVDIHGERASGICECVHKREPVPWKGITDMHAHYGYMRVFPYEQIDPEGVVREMDRIGIERVFVAPTPATSPETEINNDRLLDAVRACPGRILGYAICYPRSEAGGLKAIERAIDAGLHGIKMHDANHIAYEDKGYEPVWAYADERRLPVLLHTWGNLKPLREVLKNVTRAPVLLGHSGAGSGGAEAYVETAKEFPNVYLEMCWSQAPYGLIEHFVSKVGADRILWGSDSPIMSFSQQIGRVLFADISDDDKKQILVENPKRALGEA